MQKAIPPRLVEPYLTGRRAVIAGFVYRVQDSSFGGPAEYYEALDLGYDGSDFRPDLAELYVMRWNAVGTESYQVPYSTEMGGDWSGKPPFTGTGYTSSRSHVVAEFYLDPVPVPIATSYAATASASPQNSNRSSVKRSGASTWGQWPTPGSSSRRAPATACRICCAESTAYWVPAMHAMACVCLTNSRSTSS